MTKRKRIIYWIFTIWMSLGMISSGLVQILHTKEEVDLFTHLGYPLYLLTLIGVSKFLGVIIVLVPKFPLLKEWAYAGFVFTMLGAFISHIILGDSFKETFSPFLLLVITGISWWFRPGDRKLGLVLS